MFVKRKMCIGVDLFETFSVCGNISLHHDAYFASTKIEIELMKQEKCVTEIELFVCGNLSLFETTIE